MTEISREFQVLAKPAGALCNLECLYCYYLEKGSVYKKENNSGPAVNELTRKGPAVNELTRKGPACINSESNPQQLPIKMNDRVLEMYIVRHISASAESLISFSWHGGEPTMAGIDFFRKVVELQKKHVPAGRKIVNGIQTNGTLFNDEWFRFLASEKFVVGLSIDGPEELHDLYRRNKSHDPTFHRVMKTLQSLKNYDITFEILCVVHSGNAGNPLGVYRFFRDMGARFMTFLPLVVQESEDRNSIRKCSVIPEDFGDFMISIFDEWVEKDIGKIKVQLFEEAARTAFNQDHTLCIFKETCGGVPVVEHNGDFYSCDHFVDSDHLVGNIMETGLDVLLDSEMQKDFGRAKLNTLPQYCMDCEVRSMCNGECPKNRFVKTPDGEPGLNYLCKGYRKFFNHCRPFVNAVAAAWQYQRRSESIAPVSNQAITGKVSRNSPCGCGSGKKYKRCCL